MIAAQPIGFLNTALPVAVLALAAALIPRLLVGAGNTSHAALVYAVALTALAVLTAGAMLLALIYSLYGTPVGSAFAEAPAEVAMFFLRRFAPGAIAWVPVLGLTWFAMAQGVERRRGEARSRVGR